MPRDPADVFIQQLLQQQGPEPPRPAGPLAQAVALVGGGLLGALLIQQMPTLGLAVLVGMTPLALGLSRRICAWRSRLRQQQARAALLGELCRHWLREPHHQLEAVDPAGHLQAGAATPLATAWLEQWSPASRPAIRLALATARRGRLGRFSGRRLTPAGQAPLFEALLMPLFDPGTPHCTCLVLSRPVDALPCVPCSIPDSLLESLEQGICQLDEAGCIVQLNQRAAQLLGRPRRRLLGTCPWQAGMQGSAPLRQTLAQVLHDGSRRQLTAEPPLLRQRCRVEMLPYDKRVALVLTPCPGPERHADCSPQASHSSA